MRQALARFFLIISEVNMPVSHAANYLELLILFGSATLAASGAATAQRILSAIHRHRPDIHTIIRTAYLKDANTLHLQGFADVVVAEFETSMEILARALKDFGVTSQKIHEFILRSREEILSSNVNVSDSLRRTIDLPAWEALSSIRPFKVQDQDYCVGKTLTEVNLRHITGASIVSVYREGLGSSIPDANFVIAPGDILHHIGSQDALNRAESLLVRGRSA